MDKKFIIANWKMKLGHQSSLALAQEIIKNGQIDSPNVEVILGPSFESLAAVADLLKNSKIKLAAQDCFWENEGAFTGEVSPKFLGEIGCEYVIIGHSERRQNLGETDEIVNKKVLAAVRNNLVPIVCVGETFEQRKEGNKDFVIMEQVQHALNGLKLLSEDKLIIAYEPVWVIGSGQAVMPEEAEHTSKVIKQVLYDNFEIEIVKNQTAIIYGGSVNQENVSGFLDQPTVSGILVGGASLQAESFISLIQAALK